MRRGREVFDAQIGQCLPRDLQPGQLVLGSRNLRVQYGQLALQLLHLGPGRSFNNVNSSCSTHASRMPRR